jgi:hypothetical protein
LRKKNLNHCRNSFYHLLPFISQATLNTVTPPLVLPAEHHITGKTFFITTCPHNQNSYDASRGTINQMIGNYLCDAHQLNIHIIMFEAIQQGVSAV